MGGVGAGATSRRVSGDPVTSPWDTSKGKTSWPPQGGLRPQTLNGFVSAPTKAGPVPDLPNPAAPSPPGSCFGSSSSIATASCSCPDMAHSPWGADAQPPHPLCREARGTSLPNCASVSPSADGCWAILGLPKTRLIPKGLLGPPRPPWRGLRAAKCALGGDGHPGPQGGCP